MSGYRWQGQKETGESGCVGARRAFTLIEMLVVLGILGMLMAVTFGGIGQARTRARIAKANAEARELVNAILAYEAAGGSLNIAETPRDALESELAELLGNTGGPVYLNAPMVNSAFRDPWGTPYRFRVIERVISSASGMSEDFAATVTFPNRGRGIK